MAQGKSNTCLICQRQFFTLADDPPATRCPWRDCDDTTEEE